MHTIIVANAPAFDAAPFIEKLRAADLLIAADGGGNALHRLGITPTLVIGDLDSLDEQAAVSFAAAGAEFQRHPTAKDETDLELALLMALERGARSIDILGALGGRWDQSLSNVALLALPELAGTRVRLLDHEQEAFIVRDEAAITGKQGDTVSLLPIGGPAHGITTRGLHYPLHEATLHFERTRGISNVISVPPAHVSLRAGLLLVVHTFSTV